MTPRRLREGAFVAQPFSPRRDFLEGDPIRLVEDVEFTTGTGYGSFSASLSGTLVYRRTAIAEAALIWFDRMAHRVGTVARMGREAGARGGGPSSWVGLSPDSSRVAVVSVDPMRATSDIWIVDLSRGTRLRLTSDPAWDTSPVWSPDSTSIVFRRYGVLYRKKADGSGDEERIFAGEGLTELTDWSRDGRFIAYEVEAEQTKRDIWILRTSGDRQPVRFLSTASNEQEAHFSPDGRFIAYTSDESGRGEVYVRHFPDSGERWQISTDGGATPRWRASGDELYYRSPGGAIMAVAVKTGASFESSVPQELLRVPAVGRAYAVSTDGQRFLMYAGEEVAAAVKPLTVYLNWTARLPR